MSTVPGGIYWMMRPRATGVLRAVDSDMNVDSGRDDASHC